MAKKLIIATSQFPVSRDIQRNTAYILKQMKEAGDANASVVHFCESSLSGYPGIDFDSLEDHDHALMLDSLEKIKNTCRELEISAIVGGHHFEKGMEKPYNCLWLIDAAGEIRHRYDKRFLTGNYDEEEHYHYSPGTERVIFKLNGIPCGLLICHEWRYPELYRDYMKAGVQLIFQSWYDGGLSISGYENEGEEQGSLITGYVRGNAANNYLWISASNTCRPQSSFPAFVTRPDGRIINKLKRNITGLMISEIDPDQDFTDPSGPWRGRAHDGIFNSA